MAVSVERTGTNIQKAVLRDTDGFAEPSPETIAVVAELLANTKLRMVQLTGFLSVEVCARLTEEVRPLMRQASHTQYMGNRRSTDILQVGASRGKYGQAGFTEFKQERFSDKNDSVEKTGREFGMPKRVHDLLSQATGLEHRAGQEQGVSLGSMVFRHINSADIHTDDICRRVPSDSELQDIVAQCSWNVFFCVTAKGGCTRLYDGDINSLIESLPHMECLDVHPETGNLVLMNTASLHEVESAYDGLRLCASGMAGVHEKGDRRQLLSWA